MGKKRNEQFLKKLLPTFRAEASEHLKAISSGLIELEESTGEKYQDALESVFREAHSLKGAARTVNATEMERICQALESAFSTLKRGEGDPSRAFFDTLHRAIDFLGDLLASLAEEKTAQDESIIETLLGRLQAATAGIAPYEEEREGSKKPGRSQRGRKKAAIPTGDTVRVSLAKLDSLLSQTEEMLSLKLLAEGRSDEFRQITDTVSRWKERHARIQPDLRKIQQLIQSATEVRELGSRAATVNEFIEWSYAFAASLESAMAGLGRFAHREQVSVNTMVDRLQADMRQILMLPFFSLFEALPKLVRDLSSDQGKEIELRIEGSEIEIDRRILEEIKDSLIHLIRNSVDHGIEKPEDRKKRGKPSKGVIALSVFQRDNSKIEVVVGDDGAGINLGKVQEGARKLGLVSEGEQEPDGEQLVSLIFHSGVSTSPIITDISGHGLGLAIVRDKVEQVGGSVSVETRENVGTTFRIMLPLTLATFRGVVACVGDRHFVFPIASVDRVIRVNREEIKTVENRETIRLGDQVLSLVWLGGVLGLPIPSARNGTAAKIPVAVLQSGEERMAFAVDEILGEQEVLVKNLGEWIQGAQNVAGAAILATGKVIPILKVSDLIRSARETSTRAEWTLVDSLPEKRSVLVVEDSITARTLLKSILEAVGYEVGTAVDGVDGFTQLKSGGFDLVVSDIEMPRMNGLDLTAKIRADKTLADLPVVLVTALESREDRERGIDVGANAYIVKSSFDQSNLLEVIHKLL